MMPVATLVPLPVSTQRSKPLPRPTWAPDREDGALVGSASDGWDMDGLIGRHRVSLVHATALAIADMALDIGQTIGARSGRRGQGDANTRYGGTSSSSSNHLALPCLALPYLALPCLAYPSPSARRRVQVICLNPPNPPPPHRASFSAGARATVTECEA